MEKTLELARDLIRIPSVSGNEEEIEKVFNLIEGYFKGTAAVVKKFSFKEPGAYPMMLVSNRDTMDFDALALVHIDVVPASEDSQYEPIEKDGRLLGRGASDMKTQTAIVLENLKYVMEQDLPISYGVLIDSDEETTSGGIKVFMKENPQLKTDVLLDVDGGSLNQIIFQYKHPVTVKLSYQGKEGHSSRIWEGNNSVNGLMRVLQKLSEGFGDFDNKPEPADTWISTMSVTDFRTDFKANNVIPAYSEARISFRLTEKLSFEDLKKRLDECTQESGASYEFIGYSKGLFMDKNDVRIKSYREIAEEVTGKSVTMTHMHGATDSRFFSDWPDTCGGKTSIIVHSFDGGNHHGKGEYVEIDSAEKLLQIQRKFLKEVAARKEQ